MRIVATLPKDRTRLGVLRLFEEKGSVLLECPCYAKADNAMAIRQGNPTRDPLRPFGDTPLGFWKATIGPRFTKPEDVRTYGVHKVIMLSPLSGDAKRAYDYGRRGIWNHGGALNAAGRLRPTHGCIRVHDEHQAALLDPLDRYFATLPVPQRWCIYETLAA